MLQAVRKKILIVTAIAGVLYLGASIALDFSAVSKAVLSIPWYLFPLLLTASLINYFFRWVRWELYLKQLRISLKRIDSIAIFLSGFIMSITPGKMGELIKSYLIKQVAAVPVRASAPVVIAERLMDFIALTVIALVGAYFFDIGRVFVICIAVLFAFMIFFFLNQKLSLFGVRIISKVPYLKKISHGLEESFNGMRQLLQIKPFVYAFLLSCAGWLFECFSYYIILRNLDVAVDILWASFVYAFATIAGALSFLPGGLGVTEGSMTYFVTRAGAAVETGAAAAFLIRILTLWFGVLVGSITVFFYAKRYRQLLTDTTITME